MRVERRFIKGAEVRALAENSAPRIEGYAAVFNEFYQLYQDPNFEVRETIAPGAFTPVMQDDVRCLFNHDADNVLGRSTNGTLVFTQDDKGLVYANIMDPDTRIGKDVYAFIKRGDVTGCSFAFTVSKAEWVEEELESGVTRWTRTISAMEKLYDVGPVTYPAYEQTSVDARELRSAEAFADLPADICNRIKAGKVVAAPGMSEDVRAALVKQTEINTTI